MTGNENDYVSITEISGDDVTQEQVQRLCNRYYWAGKYCAAKDVVEVACGTGQGLGYLSNISKSIQAGDYSKDIIAIAEKYYKNRIPIQQFDAQNMPYSDHSKDIIILFEAIYYIPDPEKFIRECVRVLRPNGQVLIATANKDLFDFNPSPNSYQYFGVVELHELLQKFNFKVEFFGDTPTETVSLRQKIVRPIKKLAVDLNLMPKSMAGKKLLKRFVFGNLVKMPAEIDASTTTYIEPDKINSSAPNTTHKVILCAATINGTKDG